MSAVGLTKAQESGLQYIRCDHGRTPTERVFLTLYKAGLCTPGGGQLTPRGHAALAAPRMTQAELEAMVQLEGGWSPTLRMHARLVERGWAEPGVRARGLTPAGLKALNDIRAAMGSELYKDMP